MTALAWVIIAMVCGAVEIFTLGLWFLYLALSALTVALLVAIGGYFGVDLLTDEQAPAGSTVSGLPACEMSSLPDEAEETAADIVAGGPFEYPDNDGTRFGKYTVDTPGLDHRGARRIVTGGGTDADPDIWYYTPDHYESFCEIPDAS